MRDKNFYPIFNGHSCREEHIAKLLYNDIDAKYCDANHITNQIDWVLDNCDNVNEVALSNILECFWYDYIGVCNLKLQKKIRSTICDYVKQGKVMEW